MKFLAPLLLLAASATAQSKEEIKCIRDCDANSSCQSVFSNSGTGECKSYDCTFTAKAEPGWTYSELINKPNRKPCSADVVAPTHGSTGGPLKTSTSAPPVAPTTRPNAAPAGAAAGVLRSVWAAGGMAMLVLG